MKALSYIEVTALVRELSALIGARLDKIYHPSNDEIVLNLYHTGLKKTILRILLPTAIYLTTYKKEYPEIPSHFCMFLRKYLTNSRLTDVKQPEFERIIELHFKKDENGFILICELFSKGNVIICDENYQILVPLKTQFWKDRTIKPKEKYIPPPFIPDLNNLNFQTFRNFILESGKDQIVKSLAVVLSMGGTYSEELCAVSNIDKTKNPKELTEEELKVLFSNFNSLLERSNEGEIKAAIIYENEKPIDVQPFPLSIYTLNKKESFDSYTEALDSFFSTYTKEEIIGEKESVIDEEIIKLEKILEQHKNYLEELKSKSQEYKKKADLIYQHLSQIESMVTIILDARDKNIEWPQIIQRIEQGKAEGNKDAVLIKEIIPEKGILILNLDGEVELDFKRSVTENTNEMYETAKKFEGKFPGVEEAIKETEEKIEELKKSRETVQEKVIREMPKKIERAEKEWFERFHWFYTSEGRLVIGGRDATQNEIIIKKYLEPEDIVLHGDVHGSPFAIIKKGRDSTDLEKTEAATFTLCHSKAWQNKMPAAVYWVNPHQVSKKAPTGEYIGKGAFMIYGKKNYVKEAELRYAIGVQFEPFRIISGPVDNVRKKAKYYAVILPDGLSKDDLAKKIKWFLLSVCREADKELIEQIKDEEIKEHAIQSSKIFGVTE